jgi:hypothetical protein
LRNAIIAVLAHDRRSTLWDAARLLSVGEEGYAYRCRVGAHVRALPELKEISEFFTAELTAQLADARSTTTAKLDAPVNKLARLLNSPSIKRVLLNDSLRVDFDRVIARAEVLVVKGALGAMGAGNTAVLMQLLLGMLDAALARQQDLVPVRQRVAVALKIDEAPLVLNRGFAETMALKRSAGLETVACWQTDAQWVDREVREQLDALFAHRVYFATASARDARAGVALTMAEFSDTVRPGIQRLSALGHPDVRLHLPKHHAIASWSTADGRQAPFIAQTLPLRVDHERLAVHAAAQRLRGARHLRDLRQPHWERRGRSGEQHGRGGEQHDRGGEQHGRGGEQHDRDGERQDGAGEHVTRAGQTPVHADETSRVQTAAGSPAPPSSVPAPASAAPEHAGIEDSVLPETAAESYRELVELDGAHRVRWARRVETTTALSPDAVDLEVLALIASFRHLLASQIHRCFNPGRAATTTQRRLKRLADAGLVERLQFHRSDGGGIPMCYLITPAGARLLGVEADLDAGPREHPSDGRQPGGPSRTREERWLREARSDVHAAGWALALRLLLGPDCGRLRGSAESVLSPPPRLLAGEPSPLRPTDLQLPGGRVAHDFLHSEPDGERVEADRFHTVRPHAIVEVKRRASAVDVIVEFENRLPSGRAAEKLERYDHFLSGWSAHTRRYGQRREAVPVVVFVCADRVRARESARRADALLGACQAYAGEYPHDWRYPGRERILFVSERDIHERLAHAYAVPRLPPKLRVRDAHGDPRAGAAVARPCMLPVYSGQTAG